MLPDSIKNKYRSTSISPILWLGCFFVLLIGISCTSGEVRPTNKVETSDSLPFMHSIGVSTLISDSGIIRYHLVAEEWDIYTPADKQPTWNFIKGLLMLRFDEKFEVDLYVQADTAYLHEQSIWELRGRVRIRNMQGTIFKTEEIYWDLDKHEMWNHAHMVIITPERTLEGTEFRSNEKMTRYSVANSKGDFPMSDTDEDKGEAAEDPTSADSLRKDLSQEPVSQTPQISRISPTKTVAPTAAE